MKAIIFMYIWAQHYYDVLVIEEVSYGILEEIDHHCCTRGEVISHVGVKYLYIHGMYPTQILCVCVGVLYIYVHTCTYKKCMHVYMYMYLA